MYCVKSNVIFKTVFAFSRFYRIGQKSHYDVLNLRKNATDKEIKDAFIKMSKEFHPDINKDRKAQEKFVQIAEAYNILSKPKSRAQYDNTVQFETNPGSGTYVYRTAPSYNVRYSSYTNFYQDFYQNQAKQRPTNQDPNSYYGVKGIRKQPNYIIIALCIGIAVFGTFLQVVVIREAYMKHKHITLQRSIMLSEELERVREAARAADSNEAQTKLLLERIVAAANTTAATASLGHALAASDQKDNDEELKEEWIWELPKLINE